MKEEIKNAVIVKMEMKKIYEHAANEMERLKDNFVDIERIMRGDYSFDDKLKIVETNYPSDESIFNIEKKCNREVKNLTSIFGSIVESAYDDEEVKAEYNNFLFQKEEAEYMYPHARGAVEVFIRDNGLVMQ